MCWFTLQVTRQPLPSRTALVSAYGLSSTPRARVRRVSFCLVFGVRCVGGTGAACAPPQMPKFFEFSRQFSSQRTRGGIRGPISQSPISAAPRLSAHTAAPTVRGPARPRSLPRARPHRAKARTEGLRKRLSPPPSPPSQTRRGEGLIVV